ncbi:MAG: FixH family protein [Bacteroidales bacterium]|nr:FixH family protein [Bacteroidales bacterium]
MKIKFNWGTGIFIVLTVFILAVVAFFIFITTMDVNLVEDNYYEKELAYQERIDRIKNTAALPGKVIILKSGEHISIQFPEEGTILPVAGIVHFYRPSDPGKDLNLDLQLNDSLRQVFSLKELDPGKWTIKLDWTMGGKGYYFEEGLIIEH